MTGPRNGSRVSRLLALQPGDRLFWEAGDDTAKFMQQLSADIGRAKLRELIALSHLLSIEVSTKRVLNLVMVTRKP